MILYMDGHKIEGTAQECAGAQSYGGTCRK